MKIYREKGVVELEDSDASERFAKRFNDLFDCLNVTDENNGFKFGDKKFLVIIFYWFNSTTL